MYNNSVLRGELTNELCATKVSLCSINLKLEFPGRWAKFTSFCYTPTIPPRVVVCDKSIVAGRLNIRRPSFFWAFGMDAVGVDRFVPALMA